MPGERCEQIESDVPLSVPEPQTRPSLQDLTDAQEEASRLSYEYSRVLDEAYATGNPRADNPEIVAAREAALDATNRELRLRREFYGEGLVIPSTTCRNCGMTLDSDRSMPGKVPGHSSVQDRCPVCARYLDGYKYPDP